MEFFLITLDVIKSPTKRPKTQIWTDLSPAHSEKKKKKSETNTKQIKPSPRRIKTLLNPLQFLTISLPTSLDRSRFVRDSIRFVLFKILFGLRLLQSRSDVCLVVLFCSVSVPECCLNVKYCRVVSNGCLLSVRGDLMVILAVCLLLMCICDNLVFSTLFQAESGGFG